MKYFVSRQHYYYSGDHVVEVAMHGLDYAGSDMLCAKYEGEATEYENAISAVNTAIDICRKWRDDGCEIAKIAVGSTGGMGMELEPDSFKSAREWAIKRAAIDKKERVDKEMDEAERMWGLGIEED